MARHSQSFNVLALVLIILGLLLTLENFKILKGVIKLWPFITFITGLGFCLLFYQRRKKDLVLLGMGTFMTLISLFFFYLNFTSWYDLSYLWPIFITILGFSFIPPYYFKRKNVLLILAAMLIGAGVAFIFVFAISTRLWPLSLVVAGGSFLIIGYFMKKNKR